MRTAFGILACILMVLLPGPIRAQEYDELLSDILRSAPGRDRARQLTELAASERKAGRIREALEFAIMGSTEAERHGATIELSSALLEMARAHQMKGDLDHAIGNTVRASMVQGAYHTTLRTDALLLLAELYLDAGHPHKSLEHLNEASLSTTADRLDRSRYLRLESRALVQVLAPEPALGSLEDRVAEAIRLKDPALQLDLLAMLATQQTKAGRHAMALASEEQVMQLAIRLDRPVDAGISANNLGALHHWMGNSQDALAAFNRGWILVEDLPHVRSTMQLNAANAHARAGQPDVALRLANDVMDRARRSNDPRLLARSTRTRSAVHLMRGDLLLAQAEALEALAIAEAEADHKEQAAACDMLSTIFMRRDLPAEARNFERKARELEQLRTQNQAQAKADREARLLRLQRIEREQADILNREQRKESKLRQLALDAENREKEFALLIYEKQLEESARREALLAKDQAGKELQLAQAMLDTERQERLIMDLDNDRTLQELHMAKLESEQKEQLQAMEVLRERSAAAEADQKRQEAVKKYSMALAGIALLAAVWMTWAWVITRRKKRTIWEQNQQIKGINNELEARNHDIRSSLTYARTIQSAILPSEDDLKAIIPDSFLLYKPLDVVSGDLPFIKRMGDRVVVAAIDCTGHGVPAAMMTFIAYYGLNDLLHQYSDEPAGSLLDRLHHHVWDTMEARGEENLYNDGFDISLCCIDLATGTLSFAGAQLPLLLVRNGELLRLKGDVLPLGDKHFERRQGYRSHTLDLLPRDTLYLLSDGFVHQFGGSDGRKKLSMKQLSSTLVNISDQDLGVVKQRTEELFRAWKGDTPQTDDVLLIGMRYAA